MPRQKTDFKNVLFPNVSKILFVGDGDSGKSGLIFRLTNGYFQETASARILRVMQSKLPQNERNKKIEREIWIWDFAGHADYRLIHQLLMDDVAVVVLVFNPQNETPFNDLEQWDNELRRVTTQPYRKILVAGRCDRGGLMVSRKSIERFCKERGFSSYLETSAYTGAGCLDLRKTIIKNAWWKQIPCIRQQLFEQLKANIVEMQHEGRGLLTIAELKKQLEKRLPIHEFTMDELRAAVSLLTKSGLLWELNFNDFILLQPESICEYAAAVIRTVRHHIDKIGCIPEASILAGQLDYQNTRRLMPDEERIVLRAMQQTFINRNICLHEHTERGPVFIFPSYFKRERLEPAYSQDHYVKYQFTGAMDEIFQTLLVQLHYTRAFENDQLGRLAAVFKTQKGKSIGLEMSKQTKETGLITIFFEQGVHDDTRVDFTQRVHNHLKSKDQNVLRVRDYICPHCQSHVEDYMAIRKRVNRGLKDIVCANCEQRVEIQQLIELRFVSDEFEQRVREFEEQAQTNIDNESRELILVGHAFAIAGEAGQIFRPTPNSDWGIDGEIEFKNDKGEASGKRVYLQLKSDKSYRQKQKADGKEVFTIKNPRHAEYWQAQAYPVMLVIRTSDGQIRWMNVTDYLKQRQTKTRQIIFEGEPFTVLSVNRLKDRLFR